MNSPQDRSRSRKQVLLPGHRPPRRSGVVSSADIEAAVAASGIPDEPSDIRKKDGKVIKPLRSKPVLEGEKSDNPEERKMYGK
jgi:hypothetical protein